MELIRPRAMMSWKGVDCMDDGERVACVTSQRYSRRAWLKWMPYAVRNDDWASDGYLV